MLDEPVELVELGKPLEPVDDAASSSLAEEAETEATVCW